MRTKEKCYTTLLLLLTCLVLLGFPLPVDAHVYLEQSTPAPESQLEVTPQSVHIQFNHSIQTGLSKLWLQDEHGQKIEGHLSGHKDQLLMDVPPLEDGIYGVYWRIMSLDAKVTEGSYSFAVGEDMAPDASGAFVSTDPLFSNRVERDTDAGGWNRGIRAIELLMVLAIAGWVLFRMFLWSAEGDRLLGYQTKHIRAWEKKLFTTAAFVLLVTGSGQVFQRALQLTQTSWQDPLLWKTVGTIVVATLLGLAVVARVVIMLLLAALADRTKSRNMWKFGLLLGLIFTFALMSHAYHSRMFLPHTIHILAVAFWVSGLLGFTMYSFRMKREWTSLTYLHQRLQRFSTLTIFILLIAILSGLMISMVYVGTWDNLTDSAYGQTLLWKIILFAPVLLIAAWHRWVWWPALREAHTEREGAQRIRGLLWGLRIELVLALGVIVLAGTLSQISPPGDLHQGHNHGGVHIDLERIQSPQTGEMMFHANVRKDYNRLQDAHVTFNVWDKKHEDLFIDLEDYCQANNMRVELFQDALVERGFIQKKVGEETEEHLYVGRYDLEPGLWNVGVRVKHDAEGIDDYKDFTVEVNE